MKKLLVISLLVLIGIPAHAEFLPPRADSGLVTVEQLLGKARYSQAISALEPVLKRHPANADAQAYMGYAYLKLEELKDAEKHLKKALRVNSKHLGANHYLGEYYLAKGDKARALEQLQVIRTICYTGGCAEQIALEIAINKAKKPAETN